MSLIDLMSMLFDGSVVATECRSVWHDACFCMPLSLNALLKMACTVRRVGLAILREKKERLPLAIPDQRLQIIRKRH
jgi:hypothetical protein